MKRVLMVATGGTIASKPTPDGLAPQMSADELLGMVPQIGLGMYPSIFVDVMKEMAGQPLELLPGHMLKGITPEGVTFTKLEDQSEVCLKADSVILSLGLKPRRETVSAFEKEFGRVIPLGEARRTPGRVATSMEDGYIMARGFDPEA